MLCGVPPRLRRYQATARAATAMAASGAASAGSRSRFTTSTMTMTRTNITVHASRMPLASAGAADAYAGSRLCFENASVTAVEDTRPPVSPVSGMPRCVPSSRVAT